MQSIATTAKNAGLKDPAQDMTENWHPDYTKGQIMEAEEKLHLQLIWQRVGRIWLTVGNFLLVAAALSATILPHTKIANFAAYIYIATISSLIVSPILVYLQYKRTRTTRLRIRKLNLIYRKALIDQDKSRSQEDPVGSPLTHQKRYRDDMPDLISKYREEANRNRRIHNRFQTVVIVGSVVTSAITTASVSYSQARWFAVAISALVGLSAGFTGYFKYHERSFSSQQAADAIEREYEAVELRIGKYARGTDADAYAVFADTVERIRDEQNKRQQQLDQPAEVKREE
jgi:hypothetical protein